jgi:ubiquinone/menaquinone biosynthesis C-methylase UbiE
MQRIPTRLRDGYGRVRNLARRAAQSEMLKGSDPGSEAGSQPSSWFGEHYEASAREIVEFLAGDGIELVGRRVADVGCGDGIIDLGLAHRAQPERLVGFDVNPVDKKKLLEQALAEGVADKLPDCLEFRECGQRSLPAEDESFDVVVTWSAFEHIGDPAAVFGEIRRVLRPYGTLMLQLWPFYHSQHGAHLEEWYPAGFVQLLKPAEEIDAEVRSAEGFDEAWAKYKLDEFHTLNRVTLDTLQEALLSQGFRVAKLELLSHAVHIPTRLARERLSLLGIAGVKLLATTQWGE